jgi:hypothetical protein
LWGKIPDVILLTYRPRIRVVGKRRAPHREFEKGAVAAELLVAFSYCRDGKMAT